jgi:hypothetical protein
MQGNRTTRELTKSKSPINGQQRVDSSSGIAHLQHFFNGKWTHDYRCKKLVNRNCNELR